MRQKSYAAFKSRQMLHKSAAELNLRTYIHVNDLSKCIEPMLKQSDLLDAQCGMSFYFDSFAREKKTLARHICAVDTPSELSVKFYPRIDWQWSIAVLPIYE